MKLKQDRFSLIINNFECTYLMTLVKFLLIFVLITATRKEARKTHQSVAAAEMERTYLEVSVL